MISRSEMPAGVYSVQYKALWNNECMGNNAVKNMVIELSESHYDSDLPELLMNMLNEEKNGKCEVRHVEIFHISRLDKD